MPLRDEETLIHCIKSYHLNIYGVPQTRAHYQLNLFSSKAYETWVEQILKNIQEKSYSKAEIALKILVESGKYSLRTLSNDSLFKNKIISLIAKNYNTYLNDGT